MTYAVEISAKARRALEVTDNLPIGLRECVHEFGFAIVTACVQAGVKEPNRIRQLVHEIWAGARQASQKGDTRDTLDWLLNLNGGQLSYRTLSQVLAKNNYVIAPVFPTRAMLDASMAEVSGFNVRCTREEKHKRRLHAALKAAQDATIIPVRTTT